MASPSSPSAPSPWRGSRPTTNMSVSPIRHCWRAISPISICSTPRSHRHQSLNAAPVKPKRPRSPCKVPVVFDPRVSGSLVGHLVGAVNGASIARKTSFLRDRLGEQLFAKNVHIIDDPLRVRGLRSQSFDAEGVKVKKLAIVDEGVLTSWLLDCATARELGLVTTGHAHRGVSSSPSPGAYNLHLEAGEPTPAELMSDI